MTPVNLLTEALGGMTRRIGRSVLTSLGTVLGVGALVATLGLTSTAAAQISNRFDLLKATEVSVQDTAAIPGDRAIFPPAADSMLGRLNGVVAGGQFWTVTRDAPVQFTSLSEGQQFVTVQAASPGALLAMEPTLASGKLYASFAEHRGEPVAVVGIGLARQLGISPSLAGQSAITVDSNLLTVVAIVDDVKRNPVLVSGLAVPLSTARGLWGRLGQSSSQVLIHTDIGAAQLIARQAPIALLPSAPGRLLALAPPSPESLRVGVEGDINGLFLILAVVSLAVGGLSIANTTLISVLERIPEIGLRRAIGASRTSIALQFIIESGLLGGLGGLFGTAASVVVVVIVSLTKGWTPVMAPAITLIGTALGTATGLVAGLYPAIKAARVQPIAALRR